MTDTDPQAASRAVRRMLIKRIGVTSVLIALALGALVYAVEQKRLNEVIVDFTQRRVAQFAAYAETAMTQPDAVQGGTLQAALEAFVHGRLAPREGHIIAVRIFDHTGQLAAHAESAGHAQRAEAATFLDGLRPAADEFQAAAAREVALGGVAHIVGKIGVPEGIALKPGRLDPAEFSEMQKHVSHGLDIALTSRRPYKEPLDYEAAMGVLAQRRGTHFDSHALDALGGIAPGLYQEFANRDDAHPREVLAGIVARYFKQNFEAVLTY